jgi:hypothetical protein
MSRPVGTPLCELRLIEMASEHHSRLIAHARRKLRGEFRADETRVAQAFGLLAGAVIGNAVTTTDVLPLRRNLRTDPAEGAEVDAAVRELGVESRTPLEQRGWLASPREVMEAQNRSDARGTLIFGSYHMHKVPWQADPLRDEPTALDTALGEGQGLWMLIVSMVDPDRPIIRAFWEGRPEVEAAVRVG